LIRPAGQPKLRRPESLQRPVHLMRTTMRKLVVLAASAAMLLVAGCNTIAGAGKDVSAVGHAVTNTAKDASR
jgi:predicted small secreted protein